MQVNVSISAENLVPPPSTQPRPEPWGKGRVTLVRILMGKVETEVIDILSIKQEKDNHLSHCFSDFSPNLVCGKQQTNSVPE